MLQGWQTTSWGAWWKRSTWFLRQSQVAAPWLVADRRPGCPAGARATWYLVTNLPPLRRPARGGQPPPSREPGRGRADLRAPALGGGRPTSRSSDELGWADFQMLAPTWPSAATRSWSTARSASAGIHGFTGPPPPGPAAGSRRREGAPPTVPGRPGASREHPPPGATSGLAHALRAVRTRLTPAIRLQLVAAAWSEVTPPGRWASAPPTEAARQHADSGSPTLRVRSRPTPLPPTC